MKLIWHGSPCPEEHIAKVEAELAGMLDGMLDIPAQLIFHRIRLAEGTVIVWGEDGDEAFQAQFYALCSRTTNGQ
jgi:hypothetical protein